MNAFQELTPVLYGENGIKFLKFTVGANGMCFPAHWHDRVELLQIVSGSMDIYLDHKNMTAHTGEVIIIMPNMIHCGFSGREGIHYNMIAFDIRKFCNATLTSDKYLTSILRQGSNFCSVTDNAEVIKALDTLTAFLSDDQCSPLRAVGKIYELIGLLYQHCTVSTRQLHRPDERFGAVLSYISNHYTENISAKSISSQFGYDETYFCRRFKEATGITTMNYIRILRLEMAQRLLQTGTEDIRSIAFRCGFSDVSYFSNCFRRYWGVTPTECRSAARAY